MRRFFESLDADAELRHARALLVRKLRRQKCQSALDVANDAAAFRHFAVDRRVIVTVHQQRNSLMRDAAGRCAEKPPSRIERPETDATYASIEHRLFAVRVIDDVFPVDVDDVSLSESARLDGLRRVMETGRARKPTENEKAVERHRKRRVELPKENPFPKFVVMRKNASGLGRRLVPHAERPISRRRGVRVENRTHGKRIEQPLRDVRHRSAGVVVAHFALAAKLTSYENVIVFVLILRDDSVPDIP